MHSAPCASELDHDAAFRAGWSCASRVGCVALEKAVFLRRSAFSLADPRSEQTLGCLGQCPTTWGSKLNGGSFLLGGGELGLQLQNSTAN